MRKQNSNNPIRTHPAFFSFPLDRSVPLDRRVGKGSFVKGFKAVISVVYDG